MLQRRRREGDEAVGAGGAELHQRLVLDLDQLGRGVALGAVPVRVDAERLDVDALRVHRRDARAGVVHQQARRFERMVDHRRRRRDDAMGVHVDGLDPLAVDHDLAPAGLGCRRLAQRVAIAQGMKARAASVVVSRSPAIGIGVSPDDVPSVCDAGAPWSWHGHTSTDWMPSLPIDREATATT